MPRTVFLDELHLTVRVPADLPEADTEAAHRALLGAAFMARFRRAVRAAVRAVPELAPARVHLTR